MKTTTAVSIAAAALLASALSANAATIVIDRFDTEQYVEAVSRTGFASSSEIYAPNDAEVGGYRYMTVTNNTGRSNGTSLHAGEGYLDFSNGSRTSGTGTVVWDGMGSTGIGGLDLTDSGTNDALILDVISADASLILTFTVRDTFGAIASLTQSAAETLDEPLSLAFLFSDFSGSVDFTSLDSISLTLSGTAAALDATIDLFYAGSTQPVAAVPVPAAGLLLAGGIAALGVAKRRKRQA